MSRTFCFGFCNKSNKECSACTLYQECRKYQVYELYDLLAETFRYLDALKVVPSSFSLKYKKICLTGNLDLTDTIVNPNNLNLQDFFTSHKATITSHLDTDTDYVILSNSFINSGVKNTQAEQAKQNRIPIYTEDQFKSMLLNSEMESVANSGLMIENNVLTVRTLPW